jgi:putative PIN family toxin of toxin-antitoxin system
MRLVLDTNVLISAFLFGGVPEKVVLRVLAGEHDLIISPYIIEETNRILRTKFNVHPDTLGLLNQLLTIAEIQYFQPFLRVVEDDPDNRIIETAIRGDASLIISGDKHLLELGEYETVSIISPAAYLKNQY